MIILAALTATLTDSYAASIEPFEIDVSPAKQ